MDSQVINSILDRGINQLIESKQLIFQDAKPVYRYENDRPTDVVIGQKVTLAYLGGSIEVRVGGLSRGELSSFKPDVTVVDVQGVSARIWTRPDSSFVNLSISAERIAPKSEAKR